MILASGIVKLTGNTSLKHFLLSFPFLQAPFTSFKSALSNKVCTAPSSKVTSTGKTIVARSAASEFSVYHSFIKSQSAFSVNVITVASGIIKSIGNTNSKHLFLLLFSLDLLSFNCLPFSLKNTALAPSSRAILSVAIEILKPKRTANSARSIKLSRKSVSKTATIVDGKLAASIVVFLAFSIFAINTVSSVPAIPSEFEQEAKNSAAKINETKFKNKMRDFKILSFEIVILIIMCVLIYNSSYFLEPCFLK